MDRDTAKEVQKHALQAITELTAVLKLSYDRCLPDEHEQIKRAVGLSIGRIQVELLEIVNREYPELDDLK